MSAPSWAWARWPLSPIVFDAAPLLTISCRQNFTIIDSNVTLTSITHRNLRCHFWLTPYEHNTGYNALYFRRYIGQISPRQPKLRHQTWMLDGIWCMHPSSKLQFSFRRVLWRRRLLYSAIFGAPVLPVRARCLKYTILSAPLHPHFGSFLLGWVTHTHNWHECMCHSLLGPCACAHSTAAPAREGMRTYFGCVHVSSCTGMPV